jgi:hypothetical protein
MKRRASLIHGGWPRQHPVPAANQPDGATCAIPARQQKNISCRSVLGFVAAIPSSGWAAGR